MFGIPSASKYSFVVILLKQYLLASASQPIKGMLWIFKKTEYHQFHQEFRECKEQHNLLLLFIAEYKITICVKVSWGFSSSINRWLWITTLITLKSLVKFNCFSINFADSNEISCSEPSPPHISRILVLILNPYFVQIWKFVTIIRQKNVMSKQNKENKRKGRPFWKLKER